MGYDIPDEIKYREKILMNLDLKQLGYAMLFGVAALLAYNLPIEGQLKFVLPSLFAIAGLLFAFLNVEEKLLDIIAYYRNIRSAQPEDPAAQNFVGVRAVRDGTIYLNNGELRAILKVYPVNFELLDEERKKSLVSNYRDFLNHLVHPVQVLVRTTDAKLGGYFEAQERKFQHSAREFSSLYTDFRIFEEKFMEENGVKERHYYLISTHQPKKRIGKVVQAALNQQENDLKQLGQQVEIMREKLSNCGLQSERLGNEQLVSLLLSYSEYSSDAPQPKKKPKPGILAKFFGKRKVEREETEKDLFRFMLTPSFDIKPDHARVNETCHRIVKVTGYPRKVEDGWLRSFLGKNEGYDISLHIHPSTITQTLVLLHNQIIRQTADLIMSTAKGTPNPALEIKKPTR